MYAYEVAIVPLSPDNGGGFTGIAPELPGCRSDGETLGVALTNTHDAIACWLEAASEMGCAAPGGGVKYPMVAPLRNVVGHARLSSVLKRLQFPREPTDAKPEPWSYYFRHHQTLMISLSILTLAWFIGCGSDAIAAPAHRVQTLWLIGAPSSQSHQLTLQKGDDLVRYELTPPNVAILSDGTVLFGLESTGPVTFCYPDHVWKSFASGLVSIGPGIKQRCLIDTHGDGRFDAAFSPVSILQGLPQINTRLPSAPTPIEPLGYRIDSNAALPHGFHVRLQFHGFGIGSTALFEFDFGTAEREGMLSKLLRVKVDQFPQEFSYLGGLFRITSRADDVLLVTVLRDIPPQPFAVELRTSLIFH